MSTTKKLEGITLEAIRKFQTLDAERQQVMLKKMDEFIEGAKEAKNTENENANNDSFECRLKYRDEHVERGQHFITAIAMQIDGRLEIIDNLLGILDLFVISKAGIDASDLAEDLERFLFTWTRERDEAFSNWRSRIVGDL